MDKAVQSAPVGKRVHYERRRPEEATLYTLVQEHLESFFVQVERETGAGLPDFVKEEFEAFLQCGSPPLVLCACVAPDGKGLRCLQPCISQQWWQLYLKARHKNTF
jgi:hypothetical protein